MGNFFYNTYQTISKNRLWASLALLVVFLGLAAIISKIQFEEDISKLIPVNSKNKDFERVLKAVRFTDKVIVNIERRPNGSVDDLIEYASVFLDSIDKNAKDHLKNVQGKIADDEIQKTMDFVYNNLPLFLEEADYTNIQQKITKDSIAAITKENYKTLISPSGIVAKKSIVKDPLGLSFIALKKLRQLGISDGFIIKDGFVLSKNEQHILLFLTPKYAPNETAENEEFVSVLYAIQNQLNSSFENKVGSAYFGAALVAVANAQQIKKDIKFTAGIAVALLLLILIFFYKKWTVPLILFLPTIFGGLLSIAFLYLIRTKISAISLGIGSVLLGVTLDYALHILTHIRNNNSVQKLYKEVAPSILMSSLTTASAFLCLLFLRSQALQDLGIFAAVSVLGSSIFALLFIPQVYKTTLKKQKNNTVLDQIARYTIHKKKWGLAIIGILLITSIFTYDKVVFNQDITKLNFEPPHLIEARERLDALTNINSKSIYLATYGNTHEEVLQANDSLYTALQGLKNNDKIVGFSSIAALVRSEKLQKERIKRWQDFWTADRRISIQEHLVASGNQLGFKPNTFSQFYTLLGSEFQPLAITDYAGISSFTIDDYIATEDDFTTITTLIKVDSANAKLVDAAFEDRPQTLLINRQRMNETFLGNLKNDFNRLIGYSIIVIFLILLLFYRSLSLTLVTGIPILITWFLTIGIMGLLHIEFNIFNIIISTFVFGLGVDYCIFITNGLLAEYRTGEQSLPTHKTSILLSVITTILGVGVLIFAKHPALYTISLVSLIGILSAAFIAFTVQPLLFNVFIGNNKKRPGNIRQFVFSVLSFTYFGLGGLLASLFSIVLKIVPVSKKTKMGWFHKSISKLMGSVFFSYPFLRTEVRNQNKKTFEKPVMIIANHTSFLDILAVGMLHPKMVYLVNDWVYNSPVFGKAVQSAGFYPVSQGLDKGVNHLRKKVAQGYSLIAFPEGSRSYTNQIKRFHKGAFFLAEQFDLDILPVLIHGNSEVLPKGTFVIRDGRITVKILDRISTTDKQFGEGYRERTKKISAYFKNEFQNLRNDIEHEAYFKNDVLQEFRYKGNALYKKVRADFKKNKSTYKALTDAIGKKDKIIHLSENYGLLDFLLLLDSRDRKINTFIADQDSRAIFKNSFITNFHSKIKVANSIGEAMEEEANVLIVNLTESELILEKISDEIDILVLLKASRNLSTKNISKKGFAINFENDSFILLKKLD